MRYRDLFDAQAWRKYSGRDRECMLIQVGNASKKAQVARVQYGSVTTGKQRVWVGYFVQVVDVNGREWLAEDPHSLRRALRKVEACLNEASLSLAVVGLSSDWSETGLSANTGYGYVPNASGPIHMLSAR
jgi:hypothetical protein